MKPLLSFGSLLLAIVAGAIGGILAVRSAPAVVEPAPVPPAAHVASVPAAADAGIARLTGELEALRSEVARLRAGATRVPAVEPAPEANAGAVSSAAFVAEHKAAILQVIESDREARAQERAQAEAERDLALTLARAERVGREVGLSPEQQKSLADVYALENAKREELRAAWRADGRVDADTAERAVREWQSWVEAELSTRFGADLAQKIKDFEELRGGHRRGRRPNANGASAVAPAGG